MNNFIIFFKYLGKIFAFIRSTILNIFLFLFLFVIIIAIAGAPSLRTPNNEALYIAPKGVLVDELTYQPSPLELLFENEEDPETLVRDVIESINKAADDDRIKGLILDLNYLQGGGISKLTEIGDAIVAFKASNKPVIAYSDYFSQQQFYLANYADEIYVNELGGVMLTGYGIYRNYFKDAADKLALKFHVFRAGEYKDAIEPFTSNEMSNASREHNTVWLNELWGRYTDTVEKSRDLPSGAINDFIATMPTEFRNFGGSHAQFAQSVDLVDGALTRLALKEKLLEKFGKAKDSEEVAAINMQDYLNSFSPELPGQAKNNIGLIVATGNILDGYQGAGSIGGDSLSELISQARNDESLKALIIRVDSGGGSAFASELIRQQLIKTKEKGLPIYISMGSVAASGGYWISAPADEIWATPSTITGSIGVWGLFANYSESIEKLGIHTDGVATSKLAGAFRADRPMDDEVKILIQASIDNIYNSFLKLTAEAREMEVENVHAIAQGRVWTGATAKELGLVDNLGSLADVIEAAANNLNLTDYEVKHITKPLTTREQIMRSIMQASANMGSRLQDSFISGVLGEKPDSANRSTSRAGIASLLTDLRQTINIPNGQSNEILTQCVNCFAP